jgi:AAA15 family ATPase/GTPase
MLQQFTVENFLSFKEREVFTLQPGKGSLKKDHKAEPIKGQWILKSAAMFGANAGGKSNFVKAIELGKKLVLKGTSADDLIDYYPFRLSSENKKKDTTIVYHILCDNKKYEYGFSYNAEQISKEWLSLITKKTSYTIFKRDTNNSIFDISYLLKQNPKEEESQFLLFLARATPLKQLFLHEVLSRNIHENVSCVNDLDVVISWFANTLKIIFPDTPYKQGVLLKAVDDNDLKRGFGALLRYFNTGVSGVKLIEVQFDKLGIPQDLQRAIKSDLSKSNTDDAFGALRFDENLFLINLIDGEIKAKKLMTVHKRIDEDDVELFSLGDESDGTIRLFDDIPLILDLIQGEKVFVVDEMERSLHPSLIMQIINLFYKYSKDISSQLIFTTHESSLMNQKIFRKDEIWLMKKDINGISSFGRMDNLYDVRFDKMLQNSYLNGEFGATPIFESEEEIVRLFSLLSSKD